MRKRKSFISIFLLALVFISFLSTNISSAVSFKYATNLKATWTDKEFNWTVTYPEGWKSLVAFENLETKDDYVITRRTLFYTPNGEIIAVDVWNNSSKLNLYDSFKKLEAIYLVDNDMPKNANAKIAGLNAIVGENFDESNQNVMHKFIFFQNSKVNFQITYSIINGVDEEAYTTFIQNFKLNKSTSKPEISALKKLKDVRPNYKVKMQAITAEDKCGPSGEYILENNPFPCASACTLTKTNCTWWAIYKRPDLKTKIIKGNAGNNWIEQAKQANITISDSATAGSIVVWDGHVAYVNSVIDSKSFNISEMNCDVVNYPGPRDVNVVYSYSTSDTYKLTLLGFIGGNSQDELIIQNKSITSGTYSAKDSIIIKPETSLKPTNGTIYIKIN